MSVAISIPSNLRQYTDQLAVVTLDHLPAAEPQVQHALHELVERYPDLNRRLFEGDQRLHSFVNVFVGNQSIRDLDGLATRLSAGDQLLIVPALAGG